MKKALIITAILVGIFLSLQVRSFRKVEFLIQRTGPESLLNELRIFQIANQQLRDQILEEEKILEEARSVLSKQTIEDEILRLRILSGEETITGEGIEITFSSSIKAFWLSDLLAQLIASGAEAAAINGIRYTSRTAGFRDISGTGQPAGILMRQNFIKAPLRLSFIGPKTEMKETIVVDGGILDRIQNRHPGVRMTVIEKTDVTISSLPKEIP